MTYYASEKGAGGVPGSSRRQDSDDDLNGAADCPLEKVAHDLLMNGMGSLSREKRNYIAIMAASRHWCTDLINVHYILLQRSLQPTMAAQSHHNSSSSKHGGSHGGRTDEHLKSWYNSGFNLGSAPAKLRALDTVNRILAHKPWTITSQHIRDLCVKSELNGNECWSLSEVIQGLTLLGHFHSFSSFILGCGSMTQPNDQDVIKRKRSTDSNASSNGGGGTQTPEPDVAQVQDEKTESKDIKSEERVEDEASSSEATSEKRIPEVPSIKEKMAELKASRQELEAEELNRRFEIELCLTKETPLTALSEDQLLNRRKSHTPVRSRGNHAADPLLLPKKFTENLDFQYEDFATRGQPSAYPTLHSLEYNWEEHAVCVLQQFYNEDVSSRLDQKFKTSWNLTYRTIGSYTSVDTSLFRRAIQVYVQCLYGIRHDDYDYSLINELLPKRLKNYIKTVSCYPERCTEQEYQSIMLDFFSSEKVHVCLLICEARLQSSLLYAYKAIHDYYKGK